MPLTLRFNAENDFWEPLELTHKDVSQKLFNCPKNQISYMTEKNSHKTFLCLFIMKEFLDLTNQTLFEINWQPTYVCAVIEPVEGEMH